MHVDLVTINCYFSWGMMFLADTCTSSIQSNKVVTLVWLIVGVAIWESGKSSVHCLPRVLICVSTFRTALQSVIYSGAVEVSQVSYDDNIPVVMIVLVDFWPTSFHDD